MGKWIKKLIVVKEEHINISEINIKALNKILQLDILQL